MAAIDATAWPIKGAAYRATFTIRDADGDLVTGAASLDSEVSKDAGTFADCTNEATELATSSGVYYLDLTASEMSADTVAVIVKTGTAGAKTAVLVLNPVESNKEFGRDGQPSAVVLIEQSVATASQRRIPFYCVDEMTGSGKLSLTFSGTEIQISKNGGAFSNMGGTATEITSGYYYYECPQSEVDTLGFIILKVNKSGVREANPLVASIVAPVTVSNGGVQIISSSGNTLRKNTAYNNFMFKMVLASDLKTAVTGATITSTRSIDGAAFAASTNTATEVANGWYKINLSAGDLNGDSIALRFTSSGGSGTSQPYEAFIVTQPT